VAWGHEFVDATLAGLVMMKVPEAVELTAITVKPNALASNPELATRTPIRVRMTFIAHPFQPDRAFEPGARATRAQPPIMAA
jgi:hypothetical protein